MGDTGIEWTKNADGSAGKTWNPIRARNKETGKVGWFCEHVSEGCRNCYAEKMNRNTYFGNGLDYKPAALDQVELFLDEKILQQPLHWRKPTNIFPCSMTDLFGRWVKDEWLDQIFAVMALAKRHTFQCLTKRPERTREYMTRLSRGIQPLESAARALGHTFKFRGLSGREYSLLPWPIPNVWLGVSCEDQKTADERIPLLLETPAAVRWISAEPLLGPVDLTNCGEDSSRCVIDALSGRNTWNGRQAPKIDWVVVGGESGPNARPMHPDWPRSIRDQCVAAGVPFFFKQWGEWVPYQENGAVNGFSGHDAMKWTNFDKSEGAVVRRNAETVLVKNRHGVFAYPEMVRVGKKAAGRLLDGREWSEFPKAKEVSQ